MTSQAKMVCQLQVQDVVVVMDEGLRSAACDVAMQLRQAGRSVDVILEAKKMKQVFKVVQHVYAVSVSCRAACGGDQVT